MPVQADGTLTYDLEVVAQPEVKQPKTLYAGNQYDGQPYTIVTEDDIALVADKATVISVNPAFGVQISGKSVSFSVLPDQLLFGGGYWSLDPRHLALVASTTPTPIPLLARSTPPLLRAQGGVNDALSFVEDNSDLSL
jgi:hypothetical protein